MKFNPFISLGNLLFIVGLFFLFVKYYSVYHVQRIEKKAIENFFTTSMVEPIKNSDEQNIEVIEDQNDFHVDQEYIGVIRIPKISLEQGLVDKNSQFNHVDRNIQILKESTMPTQENSHLILASHAGNGRFAYFKNVNQLELDDFIYIYYKGMCYTYQVKKKYEIEKTGKAVIRRNKNKKTLTLITCKIGTNRQIVVIAELINEEPFS